MNELSAIQRIVNAYSDAVSLERGYLGLDTHSTSIVPFLKFDPRFREIPPRPIERSKRPMLPSLVPQDND
jgi:hypothetical protein